MDFGSPHRVEKVVYTPRNEVNFIYKGNLYELFIGVEENGILSGGKWLCQILLSIQGFKVLYFI